MQLLQPFEFPTFLFLLHLNLYLFLLISPFICLVSLKYLFSATGVLGFSFAVIQCLKIITITLGSL